MKISQKKIVRGLFALTLFLAVFASCSKSDENIEDEAQKVKLKLKVIGSGRIDVNPKSENNIYDKGTRVKLRAIPMGSEKTVFYKFSGDIGDIDPTFMNIELLLDSDKEVTAEFTQ